MMMEFLGLPVHGISEIVLATTACAVSVAMFLYPIPSFIRLDMGLESSKRVQPYTLSSTMLACFCWMASLGSAEKLYGNSFQTICLAVVSLFGAIVQLNYISIIKPHSSVRQGKILECALSLALLLLTGLAESTLVDSVMHPEKDVVIGLFGTVFGIVMYGSTIPSIVNAYKTQNTNYLPLGLCTMHFLNAIAWFAYALYTPTYDVYIATASGAGILLGIAQHLICCILILKFRKLGATANPDVDPMKTPLLDSVV